MQAPRTASPLSDSQALPGMISKFAYFVMSLCGLGVLFSASAPWWIHARTCHDFHRFGMDAAVDGVVSAELRSLAPNLVFSLILYIAGFVVGVGILRRRAWARGGWLLICAISLISATVFTVLDPPLNGIMPVALRLVVTVLSLRILLNPSVRSEFSNGSGDAKRA